MLLADNGITDSLKQIGDAMNNTEWAFPLAECFHIAAFAVAIGTIAVVDLRLLGLGMKKQTARQLIEDTEWYTIFGLAVVIIAGFFIYLSQPEIYNVNGAFKFKVFIALPLAIVFHYAVLRPVARREPSPALGGAIAIVSLALWTSCVAGGLFIAFV